MSNQNAIDQQDDISILFQLAGQIGREPQLDGLLYQILDKSRPWIKAEACSIFLPDPETGELVIHSAHGSCAPSLHEVRIPPGTGIVGSAMREKKIVSVDDVSTDSRFYGKVDDETGFRTKSLIAAPLMDGENCIGVIEFINPIGRPSFNARDHQLVEYFSWLVSASLARINSHSAAMERALIQRDLDLAQEMQIGLLPKKLPAAEAFEDLDLLGHLKPALEVSGDLYDFFPAEDGSIYFLVGDVSGKGVAAGLFMAVTRTLIRAIAAKCEQPSDILKQVNSILYPENSAILFVTIILAKYNRKTGRVDCAQGGHNQALLIRKEAEAVYQPPGGQPLGIFENARFDEYSITLMPEDILLFYTDGITEAMNNNHDQFGADQLLTIFENTAKHRESSQAVIKNVLLAVEGFVGSAPQSDDITLLALKHS
jgi:phosphoserine phosphatase RsbU/P